MLKEIKICKHCKGPLKNQSEKFNYCSKPECVVAKKKEYYIKNQEKLRHRNRTKYVKKQKFCRFCKCDITDLYPSVTCEKQKCIDSNIKKKERDKKKSRIKYYKNRKPAERFCEVCNDPIPVENHGKIKICGKQTCIDIRNDEYNLKKRERYRELHPKKQTKRSTVKLKSLKNKPKNVEKIKSISIYDDCSYDLTKLNKFNGKRCEKCNKKLKGNYHRLCPECLKKVNTRLEEYMSSGGRKYSNGSL